MGAKVERSAVAGLRDSRRLRITVRTLDFTLSERTASEGFS